MLKAPRGVTRIAGANAYATKFATSPTITASSEYMQQMVVIVRDKMLPIYYIGLLGYFMINSTLMYQLPKTITSPSPK